jgi:hypothetical protein
VIDFLGERHTQFEVGEVWWKVVDWTVEIIPKLQFAEERGIVVHGFVEDISEIQLGEIGGGKVILQIRNKSQVGDNVKLAQGRRESERLLVEVQLQSLQGGGEMQRLVEAPRVEHCQYGQ